MIRQTVNKTSPITHFFNVAGLNIQLFRLPRKRIEPFDEDVPKSGVVSTILKSFQQINTFERKKNTICNIDYNFF